MPSSPLPPDQLVRESQAAIDRKDWPAAEELLRQAFAAAPGDPAVLLNLGLALYHRGAIAEAERFLNKAALRDAGPRSWLLLGELYLSQRRDDEALRAFKAVVKTDPENFQALMALGDIRHRHNDRVGARAHYGQAARLRPTNPDAAVKYANSLWALDPEAAEKVLLTALAAAGTPQSRAHILHNALWQIECLGRIKHGQMPYHAANLSELFFAYAAPYLQELDDIYAALAADPADHNAQAGLALTRFCRGDRSGAQALLDAAAPFLAGGVLDAIRFQPAFHEALRNLPDTALVETLPPVTTVRPPAPDAAGVLYLSCDQGYFKNFGLPMLCSLRENSPGTPVHLHIFDPAPEDIAAVPQFCDRLGVRFGLTVESPGLGAAPVRQARNYFHAVRFIRFHEHLGLYRCPLWMSDVDAIVNRDLGDLFRSLGAHDVAMRIRPGRLEPNNQFNACVVGAAQTARSRAYFRQVAAYIAYFQRGQSLRWGIDQLALYAVFADLADRGDSPSLALLDTKGVDYDHRSDGFFWCNSGARKFTQLERSRNPNAVPDAEAGEVGYMAAFDRHRQTAYSIAADVGLKI